MNTTKANQKTAALEWPADMATNCSIKFSPPAFANAMAWQAEIREFTKSY